MLFGIAICKKLSNGVLKKQTFMLIRLPLKFVSVHIGSKSLYRSRDGLTHPLLFLVDLISPLQE